MIEYTVFYNIDGKVQRRYVVHQDTRYLAAIAVATQLDIQESDVKSTDDASIFELPAKRELIVQ